jgi:hypothetical protein
LQAGHSGRVRPGPIPNPEVKPVVAAVLLTCVSGWEAAVLALDPFFQFFELKKLTSFSICSFTVHQLV